MVNRQGRYLVCVVVLLQYSMLAPGSRPDPQVRKIDEFPVGRLCYDWHVAFVYGINALTNSFRSPIRISERSNW